MTTINISIDLSKDNYKEIEKTIIILQQILKLSKGFQSVGTQERDNSTDFDLDNVSAFFSQEDSVKPKSEDNTNEEEIEIIDI